MDWVGKNNLIKTGDSLMARARAQSLEERNQRTGTGKKTNEKSFVKASLSAGPAWVPPVLRFHDTEINHCTKPNRTKTNPNTRAKCDECLNYYFLNINVTDCGFKPIFQTILHPVLHTAHN